VDRAQVPARGRPYAPREGRIAGPAAAFVDSHAHLADDAFAGDVDAVIARALAAGARAIVCIGASATQARAAAALAARHPRHLAFTAGVHPHDAAMFDPAVDGPELRDLAAGGAVAIGECGLDYHYDTAPRQVQRNVFAHQIQLAHELRLPVVVHTRDANDDTAAMVAEAGRAGVRGVLHCYTGPITLARAALEAGWYISFSGIATFRNWTGDDVVRATPAERLLVESDAPYLAPVPHRGHRNEPAWVRHTLERVAAVRGEDPDALAAETASNAEALFSLHANTDPERAPRACPH